MRARNTLILCIAGVLAFLYATQHRAAGAQRDDVPELLMRLDREFDLATSERGVEGWVSYFSENGSMLGKSGAPVTGKDAIRTVMTPLFARPGFSLRWKPTRAEVLIPGDLGYTVGRYERRVNNQEGQMTLERGTYATIWRRQTDGSWKIVMDTGSAEGPAVVQK